MIEDELLGNLLVLLDSLEDMDWDLWINDKRGDIWQLKYLSELAVATLEISFKLVKNALLDYQQTSFQKRFGKYKIDKKEALKRYEDLLNQSVKFKDALLKKAMPRIANLKDNSKASRKKG